ncbi:MAG TPA: hypothetical protein VI231_21690 [Candidatus Binatia bacterium]|jgi:hypothetical protein
MRKSSQVFIAAVIFLALNVATGCGVGRNMVIQSPQTRIRAASAVATENNSPVGVPADMKADYQSRLEKYLYGENGFKQGQELRIRYRFIQYEPGSQFGRWFSGGLGNMGEGSLTIESKFYDSNDKELATIQTEGRIGSGFLGGSYGEALDKAAEKVAEFAKTNFR